MYKINSSLRSALLLGAATAAAVGLSTAAYAQVETVTVTGSRIPQAGVISASPVTMVGQKELQLEGTEDVGTMLNNLPSVFAGQTSGEGNGSSGTVTVDLRGLGPSRTLVLVDGKRLGPGDAEVPVPDLNQIPSALIDHTEVLTGGASAVYGSDAVAGVVNFIMRKDFEGVEFDFTTGIYNHENGDSFLRNTLQKPHGFANAPAETWDGSSYDGTIVVGTNTANGKGNVTAYMGYQRQNQVLQKARDFSACSLSNTHAKGSTNYNGLTCAGSFNYDAFVGASGAKAGAYYFMQPGGNLTYFTGSPEMYFNYGAYNTLIRPNTRYQGGAFAHYEVDKLLDVYANFMFTDDHNSWQAAPSAAFYQQALGPGGALQTNCDNPLLTAQFVSFYCPGGTATAGNLATVYVARRNIEGGPRITDFRHTSYRMVVGAKGDLGDGWTYDASAQEGLALYQQLYLNDWSKQNVTNALMVNPDGTCMNGDPACVPLDLFHGVGGITPAMENYVYTHGQRTGYTEEQVLNATITGDLGEYNIKSPWAAEGVGIAGGAEYRKEVLEETTSVADYSGDLFGAGGKALGQAKSSFHVWELFGEVRIPVVHDKQFFEDLSLNAGYRYSSYSTSGAKSVHSYKYGGEWQPIDDFRLRASFQRAVRSASILDLFAPQNVVLGSFSDPCAGAHPTDSAAQCANSGVTSAQYGHILQCAANQCNYLSGGNEALKPETSDTRSFGIVLTPTFVPGLSVTVDYFNIDVKDYINNIAQPVVLAGCLTGSTPSMCSYIHRGSTGSLSTTDGYIVGTLVNTGYLQTKGVDIEANYLADLADWGLGSNGSLAFNVFGTYVSDYNVQPYTGADSGGVTHYNCVGLFGVTCGTPTPSWRHKARVTWSSPWDVDLSVNWRHLSGATFDGNSSNPYLKATGYTVGPNGGGEIAAYDYIDLGATWNATDALQFSLGVNNLFDKDPPLIASGGKTTGQTGPLNGNTFNGVYDSLGRYIFFGLVVKS